MWSHTFGMKESHSCRDAEQNPKALQCLLWQVPLERMISKQIMQRRIHQLQDEVERRSRRRGTADHGDKVGVTKLGKGCGIFLKGEQLV